jgi:hypothetical protein
MSLSNFKIISSFIVYLITIFNYNPIILTLYCLFDLYQARLDIIIHHIIIIIVNILFLYSEKYNNCIEKKYIVSALTKLEISNLFLIFKDKIINKNLKFYNFIIFIILFTYFRIFNLLPIVIHLYHNQVSLFCKILFYDILSLYILNFYWFILIIKKLRNYLINKII